MFNAPHNQNYPSLWLQQTLSASGSLHVFRPTQAVKLYDRLAKYGELPVRLQGRILGAALLNDLRAVGDTPNALEQEIHSLATAALQCDSAQDFIRLRADIDRAIGVVAATKVIPLQISQPGNIGGVLQTVQATAASIVPNSAIAQSVLANSWLISHGLSPIVHFAFDRWIPAVYDPTPETYLQQVDLSLAYLYRLIGVDCVPPTVAHATELGRGAYSIVVRGDHPTEGECVYKIPRNLAALDWVHRDEATVNEQAASEPLSQYTPRFISFDRHSAVICRSFIDGTTGHHLLSTNFFAENPHAIKELAGLYHTAQEFMRKYQWELDLHPGNIARCARGGLWALVDLGPIPRIGSEYYPKDDFQHYFQKVWRERLHRMQTEPIRSVALPNP